MTDDLNRQIQNAWDGKAAFWDDLMGDEGNLFQRTLITPNIDIMLAQSEIEHILDVGCGTGVLARHLARQGYHVTGIDYSMGMLQQAQQRENPGERIQYQHVDATDANALQSVENKPFSAVIANMSLMDMATPEPLFRVMRNLLQPNGCFIMVIPHPCFNNSSLIQVAERQDVDGELITTHSIKLSQYIQSTVTHGVGAKGEPNPHIYLHFALQDWCRLAFTHGLVMDGMLEPVFPRDEENLSLPWRHNYEIPPVLIMRFRF